MEAIWARAPLIGRILSGIAIAFLLVDTAGKLIRVAPVLEAAVKLGYPESAVFPMGALLLAGVVLHAIPRTSLLGAIYLTGFLGGAVATHFRVGSPLFSHILFAVYVAVFVWGGLALRKPRLWSLLVDAR